jgi:hypothetical protein
MEFPEHIQTQMLERGISRDEVVHTLANGWSCGDAHPGTDCRTWVFEFNLQRGRRWYAEKEVTVYFKVLPDGDILLTAKVRYGSGFPRGGIE